MARPILAPAVGAGLDSQTYDAVARAMRNQPEQFVGEDGERLTWAAWWEAVVTGRWEVVRE